jgi:hypothetical protein
MELEELELDATGQAAIIELDSIAFERWEEERREAEQDNNDLDEETF